MKNERDIKRERLKIEPFLILKFYLVYAESNYPSVLVSFAVLKDQVGLFATLLPSNLATTYQ